MEQWRESLETAMAERFDAVCAALEQRNPKLRAALLRQREASARVKDHPGYDPELKRIVADYFSAMQYMQGEYNRALYIHGAKDCAAVLRELGVIR